MKQLFIFLVLVSLIGCQSAPPTLPTVDTSKEDRLDHGETFRENNLLKAAKLRKDPKDVAILQTIKIFYRSTDHKGPLTFEVRSQRGNQATQIIRAAPKPQKGISISKDGLITVEVDPSNQGFLVDYDRFPDTNTVYVIAGAPDGTKSPLMPIQIGDDTFLELKLNFVFQNNTWTITRL